MTLSVAPQLRHGVVLSFPFTAFASSPQLGHSAVTMKKVLKAWNDSSSISGIVKDRTIRELKKPKISPPRGEKNTTPRRPNDTREDARASLLLLPGGPPPGKFGPLYILSEVDVLMSAPLRSPKRSLRDRLIPTSLKPKVFEIATPFIDMSHIFPEILWFRKVGVVVVNPLVVVCVVAMMSTVDFMNLSFILFFGNGMWLVDEDDRGRGVGERLLIFGSFLENIVVCMAPIPPTLHTDADNPWENAPLTVSIECNSSVLMNRYK